MLIYFIFVLLFFGFLHLIKDSVSRIFIWSFCAVWSGTIILSQFGFYGLYIPSNLTISLVSVHLMSFCAGFLLVREKNKPNTFSIHHVSSHINDYIKEIVHNKYFLALFFILLVYVFTLYRKLNALIMFTDSLGEVRGRFYEENIYGPYYTMLNKFILYPFSSILLFAWGYMTLKSRNIYWLIFGIFLFLYFSLSGGRFGYMRIFISFIFAWQLLGEGVSRIHHFFSKKTIWIAAISVAVYFLMVFMTNARLGYYTEAQSFDKENIEKGNIHMVSYYVGPIIALDHAITHDYPSKMGGYKYGALTFSSLEEFFAMFAFKLQPGYQRPILDYIRVVQDVKIDVGPSTWNALYTWCLFFYCDFGVIGFVIFPFLFGLFYRKVIFYCSNTANIYSLSLLCFIFVDLVLTPIKFGWQSYTILLMMLFFYYMSNRTAKINKSIKKLLSDKK